jgi:hypothetical protein
LLLGEILCSMVRDTLPPVAVERFRMARLAHPWRTHASSVA